MQTFPAPVPYLVPMAPAWLPWKSFVFNEAKSLGIDSKPLTCRPSVLSLGLRVACPWHPCAIALLPIPTGSILERTPCALLGRAPRQWA